eukprot:TRINITY_DN2142_c0_g3_i2.p1 TRINITY_DN2142_c0_g3~~TRINITY_DN2142_c0_g3_i2.p1  ORF type:complete len:239 (-),score=34.61 TRINITY_DN2142_c0_g3_i2:39-755(-)
MTNRGLFGNPLLTPRAYSGAWTQDLREAVRHVQSKRPEQPIVAIGYSLGSNVLLKYMAEEGDSTPLRAGVSISNPYDFVKSSDALPGFYSRHLVKGLIKYFEKHKDMLLKHPDIAKSVGDSGQLRVQTLKEFDDVITSIAFGFPNANAYYSHAGCYQYLHQIQRPVLMISARDDPIVDPEAIPIQQASSHDYLVLAVTEHGGHVAFPEGFLPKDRCWSDRVSLEFLQTVLEDQGPGSV